MKPTDLFSAVCNYRNYHARLSVWRANTNAHVFTLGDLIRYRILHRFYGRRSFGTRGPPNPEFVLFCEPFIPNFQGKINTIGQFPFKCTTKLFYLTVTK